MPQRRAEADKRLMTSRSCPESFVATLESGGDAGAVVRTVVRKSPESVPNVFRMTWLPDSASGDRMCHHSIEDNKPYAVLHGARRDAMMLHRREEDPLTCDPNPKGMDAAVLGDRAL